MAPNDYQQNDQDFARGNHVAPDSFDPGMTTQVPMQGAFRPAGQVYAGRRPGAQAYNSAHSRSNVDVNALKKKNRKGGKIALIVVGVIAALVIGCGAALALWVSNINSSLNFEDKEEAAKLTDTLKPVEEKEEAFYMLILGSDARSGWEQGSRSDVIMLARIDPGDSTVHLVSIPRDTMVDIPDAGTQKINAAYSFGGAAGAVETVSEFAGVDITHYAEVHFEELEEAVDMLGGVTVDIPVEFYTDAGEYFPAGEQVLNGEQALTYARERHNVAGGDFSRAQAQREIVEAIINKVLETEVTEIPDVITELASCVTTDYTVSDLILLAQDFVGKDVSIFSAICPSYTNNIDGVSYVCTMFDEWQDMMRRIDAGLDPEDTAAEIPEDQMANEQLGAATNSPAPRDYQALVDAAGLTTDDVPQAEDEQVREDVAA